MPEEIYKKLPHAQPAPEYSSYLQGFTSSEEPSSSNSRKGLQVLTETSEEAHLVAEFHMGSGESYEPN